MKTWVTDEVKRIVSTVPEVKVLQTLPSGGDYDTEGLYLEIVGAQGDKHLWVRGFRTDKHLEKSNQVPVEMVEVTTGHSDGDMPDNLLLCIAHAKIKAALMEAGFSPVNSLEPYF